MSTIEHIERVVVNAAGDYECAGCGGFFSLAGLKQRLKRTHGAAWQAELNRLRHDKQKARQTPRRQAIDSV